MIFSVDREEGKLQPIRERSFTDLNVLERSDLQEWVLTNPEILGEELDEKLFVIQSEYSKFEETRESLDILALDTEGKLVVIELKRDEADVTTDLQAIKYASYCATLTAEDIQRDYKDFRDENGRELSPDEVGQRFASFLDESFDEEVPITEEGWASFELDDKPRILLVAGSFGRQVTSPVIWLIEEYDMDITCVTLNAYTHEGELLLNAHRVIPIPEAEEYMRRRREKQEQQSSGSKRRKAAVKALLERRVLSPGETVHLNKKRLPKVEDSDMPDSFWEAEVTGKTGQSDSFEWRYDGEEYSATGLAKMAIEELTGDRPGSRNGYKYLCHPDFEGRTLSDLRSSQVEAPERHS